VLRCFAAFWGKMNFMSQRVPETSSVIDSIRV
jgi:hypothetical protein